MKIPWGAFRVCCDVRAYVSCREYDGIPKRARSGRAVKQGGTADNCFKRYSSLTEDAFTFFCQGLFYALTDLGGHFYEINERPPRIG